MYFINFLYIIISLVHIFIIFSLNNLYYTLTYNAVLVFSNNFIVIELSHNACKNGNILIDFLIERHDIGVNVVSLKKEVCFKKILFIKLINKTMINISIFYKYQKFYLFFSIFRVSSKLRSQGRLYIYF